MMIGDKISPLSVSLFFIGFLQAVGAQSDAWPEYSQQCRDDAGPPYSDDEANFGNGFYHDGSSAVPILQDGQCAPKMQKACDLRPTIKAAYLEGPLDCGNQGWYCRITPDPEWPALNLIGDLNFGHCNSTEAFEDAGYDRDGHCHGSSVDSTYYWWIRDHWHRGYNGSLRCCCGWFEGSSSQPLYERRIANRCDYRREVTRTENLDACRDANENHGMGFDDIGCDESKFGNQINKPIPEDDSLCWEIRKFGFDENGTGDTLSPALSSPAPSKSPVIDDGNGEDETGDEDDEETGDEDDEETGDGDDEETGDEDNEETGDGDDDELECFEEKNAKFYFKPIKKKGEVVGAKQQSCRWLENKKKKGKRHQRKVKKICKRKNGYEDDDVYLEPAQVMCPITCETCDLYENEDESEESED